LSEIKLGQQQQESKEEISPVPNDFSKVEINVKE